MKLKQQQKKVFHHVKMRIETKIWKKVYPNSNGGGKCTKWNEIAGIKLFKDFHIAWIYGNRVISTFERNNDNEWQCL